MTAKEKAQKLLDQVPIIKAYVSGKEIQIWETNGLGPGKWHDVKDITPNVFVSKKLRIKPSYVPFAEYDYTAFRKKFIYHMASDNIAYRIVLYNNTGITLANSQFVSYEYLVKYYRFIDNNLPVGKIVVNETTEDEF